MLELHCHSTCSDGIYSPADLVRRAARHGVKALALTDHDTMAGLGQAQETAQEEGLEIIPGLELSTTHQKFSLHILGFYPDQAAFAAMLEERRQARVNRANRILEKLAHLDITIVIPDVPAPGRLHVARALVATGYVSDTQAAFDRYLGDGKPAYEPYERLSAVDGVRLLRDYGALPVWAHPLLFKGGPTEVVLAELVAAGLQGLEVYRPEVSPSQLHRLENLAREHQLVMTGGSDFHGTTLQGKEPVELNMLHLPLTLLDTLKERAASNCVAVAAC